MPKAVVTTRGGATVTVEGTDTEVAALLQLFNGHDESSSRPHAGKKKSKSKTTPTSLVADLIDGRFFEEPRELGAVKGALEERGHFYPVTSLSGLMLRFVRERKLRRIKKDGRWLYTG